MIYGDVVGTTSYTNRCFIETNHYFIEMRFKDFGNVISYDHNFYTKEQFLAFLPFILLMERDWAVDTEHKAFSEFLGDFHYSASSETVVLSSIAYVDSDFKFHFFDLSKEYIETNHPELLL